MLMAVNKHDQLPQDQESNDCGHPAVLRRSPRLSASRYYACLVSNSILNVAAPARSPCQLAQMLLRLTLRSWGATVRTTCCPRPVGWLSTQDYISPRVTCTASRDNGHRVHIQESDRPQNTSNVITVLLSACPRSSGLIFGSKLHNPIAALPEVTHPPYAQDESGHPRNECHIPQSHAWAA